MGGGLAGRRPTLKPTAGGAIATHSQERFVANCSEGGAVIASEAKQSISDPSSRGASGASLEGCTARPVAVALRDALRAPQGDGVRYDFAVSRRIAPEVCM